jgi:multidrug resistance efflux pump
VVQRLPVRILLDRGELARYPLRVGVSMTAKVHIDDADAAPPAASLPSLRTLALRDSY